MQITKEQKKQIGEIISGMECPKDFECYESGFEKLCKAKIFLDGEMVRCLEEFTQCCKFAFNFGLGYFCKCPLRKYIAKNFNN